MFVDDMVFLFLFILFIYIYIEREREREREREKSKEISTENPGFEANVGSNSIWKLSPFIYLFLFFVFTVLTLFLIQ